MKKIGKKGEVSMGGIGGLVMLAVIAIVGVILLQASAQNISTVVNTETLSNYSIGAAPAAAGSYYFTNYKAIDSVVIYNATGTLVPAANYTITNDVVYNGGLATKLTVGAVNVYASQGWNVSGVAQPTAYADSAGRSIASLIIILMALALAAVAIVYAIKNYSDLY